MADMDTYNEESRQYEDDRDYGNARDRSRSPGPDRDGDTRIRDEPLNGRDDRGPPPKRGPVEDDEDAINPGSNLFVTGIHPRLTEGEISRLFEKYGVVEKCNIMRDPHTRESRGFGFVKMTTSDEADAAKDGLQGEVYEGRTLSIEKARRARPRTPTPGKYFGPPKRSDGPPPRREYGRDRYGDRGYGGGRRDDYRGGSGYRDRYDDRGPSRRDDYGPRGGDRGGDRYRDDRYGGDRRGGYGYDRPPRGPPPERYADAPPPRESAPRDYGDRRAYD